MQLYVIENSVASAPGTDLVVYDVSDPAHVHTVGPVTQIEPIPSPYRMGGKIGLVDKTVGALGDFGQSDVIDVSDPTHPVYGGTIPDVDQHTQELAISDRTMYLNGAAGLSVYSMTPH